MIRAASHLKVRFIQQSLVPLPFSLRFYDARQCMIYSDAIRQQMKQAVMLYKKQH
ncbi:hypothetical protein [Candidatus Sodalis pierantonius]|uniref:hypothetical protein n=1 Tax=Candidatus Sodalis pierantonii TaxID=1486991 RepID=UPI0004B887C3|nr:hypothetical protein [Candidatus Sodalis pierantonius]